MKNNTITVSETVLINTIESVGSMGIDFLTPEIISSGKRKWWQLWGHLKDRYWIDGPRPE